jgi:hypothetical protein
VRCRVFISSVVGPWSVVVVETLLATLLCRRRQDVASYVSTADVT